MPDARTPPRGPADRQGALARLTAANVPQPVCAVVERLQSLGHAAVLVGGGVRDILLERPVKDWDVASSATPQEVTQAFRKVIPTGIAHGTVTVVVGHGDDRHPVEVTTFRGEGTYLDGRRPSEVTFLRDLDEDLARRDFTINAFAWDPIAAVLADPFAGLADLHTGMLRAVGDPTRRFAEDGLRTMRAVRFCAQLGLTLDPATAAAIGPALPVLDLVSRERVRDELAKLLVAPWVGGGLRSMVDTGIYGHVLPVLPDDAMARAITDVEHMPAQMRWRLARLLWPVGDEVAALQAVDVLKPSRAERHEIAALLGPGMHALVRAEDAPALRRAVAQLGRAYLPGALAVLGVTAERAAEIEAACERAALTPGELAIAGADLVAAGIPPGPRMGAVLRTLLEEVLDDPTRNDAAHLVERARSLAGTAE